MEKSSSSICRGVHMTALRTDKFKFGLLSLSFILPLTAENASAANLAARVLNRGCAKYPTLRDISLECDRLYSASITAGCSKAGEALMMSFYVSTLDNAYAFDGTDVFGGVTALLGELLRRHFWKTAASSANIWKAKRRTSPTTSARRSTTKQATRSIAALR